LRRVWSLLSSAKGSAWQSGLVRPRHLHATLPNQETGPYPNHCAACLILPPAANGLCDPLSQRWTYAIEVGSKCTLGGEPCKAVGVLYRKHGSNYFHAVVKMGDGSFELASTIGKSLEPTGEELAEAAELTKAELKEIVKMCVEFTEPFSIPVPQPAPPTDSGSGSRKSGHALIAHALIY
jgi:hypothetical protein